MAQQNGKKISKRTELHLQDARRRGFSVLVSLAKAPNWARNSQIDEGPPEQPETLANSIHFLYQRGAGQLINAYEIWSEPNLIREWNGQPLNGYEYMRYFWATKLGRGTWEDLWGDHPNHGWRITLLLCNPNIPYEHSKLVKSVVISKIVFWDCSQAKRHGCFPAVPSSQIKICQLSLRGSGNELNPSASETTTSFESGEGTSLSNTSSSSSPPNSERTST